MKFELKYATRQETLGDIIEDGIWLSVGQTMLSPQGIQVNLASVEPLFSYVAAFTFLTRS